MENLTLYGCVTKQAQPDTHYIDYCLPWEFTEEKQLVTFESIVKDIVTGEELSGKVTLEKYEVRIVEQVKVK